MNTTKLLENTFQVGENKGLSLIHNLDKLKVESLMLASLVLVISRIVVAKISAEKAKGTPEGPHRYRESIRTMIREICGWTAGFFVLRQLQKGIQKGMGWAMDITPAPKTNEYPLWDGIKDCWKKTKENKLVERFTPDFVADVTPTIKNWSNKYVAGLVNHFKPASMEAEAFIQKVYKFAPIGLATIPTIILGGMILERMTRDHSDQFVDFVSQHLGSGQKPTAPVAPAAPVFSPAANMQPFNGQPQQAYNARFTGASPWRGAMPIRPNPLGYSVR